MKLLAQNYVHHAESQRQVAARENREMPVGELRYACLDGVNDVELRSVAPRFHDERPQMDVGSENIRAPREDELGITELFGFRAVAQPERLVERRPAAR